MTDQNGQARKCHVFYPKLHSLMAGAPTLFNSVNCSHLKRDRDGKNVNSEAYSLEYIPNTVKQTVERFLSFLQQKG